MKLPQACHRYEKCSVNDCPLESSNYPAVETDSYFACPLSDFDIEKIKERYDRIKNKQAVKTESEPLPNLNLNSERMRDAAGRLFRASPTQIKKVHSLVKNQCCNYKNGACILLDKKCPQLMTASISCSWAREAIIPLDKDLEREIFEEPGKGKKVKPKAPAKLCAACGKPLPKAARAKRCPDCTLKARKEQWAKSKRKIRRASTI